jgi:hypothetical protein
MVRCLQENIAMTGENSKAVQPLSQSERLQLAQWWIHDRQQAEIRLESWVAPRLVIDHEPRPRQTRPHPKIPSTAARTFIGTYSFEKDITPRMPAVVFPVSWRPECERTKVRYILGSFLRLEARRLLTSRPKYGEIGAT